MYKKDLSERNICSENITPALQQESSDLPSQIRRFVLFFMGLIRTSSKVASHRSSLFSNSRFFIEIPGVIT